MPRLTCQICGKECRNQNTLRMHSAWKHPEVAPQSQLPSKENVAELAAKKKRKELLEKEWQAFDDNAWL